MARRKGKFAFDMGLNYVATKAKIISFIESHRGLESNALASASVLLVQLVNGSRVSEAFEALEGWGLDLERERQVLVRKLGKRVACQTCGRSFSVRSKANTPAMHSKESGHFEFAPLVSSEKRLMLIPVEIAESDSAIIRASFQSRMSVGSVKLFALRHMGFNTHSLRYAKITQLSAVGEPAQIVAKITHHKNLNFIADYTSQKQADEVLRKSLSV